MTERILVAGATGSLGREVVRALKERGYWVRAIGRERNRLERACPFADERLVVNALNPAETPAAMQGVERIFSCLGASVIPLPQRGWKPFTAIDYPANRNLIRAAIAADVQKFVYVSIFGAERFAQFNFVQGHERVVDELRTSGLNYGVVRPTGFFSAMEEILLTASFGLMPEVKGGAARTNPIHESDLATFCVEALQEERTGQERDVGGLEALTRREIAHLAWNAHGRRIGVRVPVSAMHLGSLLSYPVSPRMAHLLAFIATAISEDCVAPPYGTRSIQTWLEERTLARRPFRPM